MKDIKIGKYMHYKGKEYEVIDFARDSETLEEVVVYKALYSSEEFGDGALWTRTRKEFSENVIVDGKEIPRFEFIG